MGVQRSQIPQLKYFFPLSRICATMDYLTSPASTSTSSSSPVSSTISSTISPLPHQQYNNYSSSTDFDEPSSSPSRNNNRTLTTTTTVTPTLASTLSDIEGRIKQINDLYAQKTRRLVAAVSRLQVSIISTLSDKIFGVFYLQHFSAELYIRDVLPPVVEKKEYRNSILSLCIRTKRLCIVLIYFSSFYFCRMKIKR